MARYVVSVERTIIQATTIYVEAKNAELAAEMVEKDAEALNSGDDSNTNLFFNVGWDLESENIEITEAPYTEDNDNA
jgi:hypothetical protein